MFKLMFNFVGKNNFKSHIFVDSENLSIMAKMSYGFWWIKVKKELKIPFKD